MDRGIGGLMQKPYFRDIWALGPPDANYPGAFPRGLVNKIRLKWWGKDRLWLFSGVFKDPDGTMIDIKPELKPTHVADCSDLSFLKDESFDFVMADPPYSEKEAKEMYDLPYFNMVKTLNEMARVCKPGGYCLFLHRIIPVRHPNFSSEFKRLKIVGIVGIFTIAAMSNIRALTVWRKSETLDQFVGD